MTKIIKGFANKYNEKPWFLFLNQLIFRYNDDGVSEVGAQLTYYIILSIFPFLISFLSVLKYTPLSDARVLESLLTVLPAQTRELLYNLINEIMEGGNITLLSFGAIGVVWSSSKGIMAIIKAVNRAFDLEETRPYWKLRGLSIIFTIGLSVALIITFSVLIFGEVLFSMIMVSYTQSAIIVWKILKVLIPFIFINLIFSLLYKFAPSIKEGINIKFKDVIPGSLFASVGWILFSFAFSLYVNNFGNYTKTYGSLGGVMILLIWIYVSSIVMILGAEVNATLISMKKRKVLND